MNRNAEDEATPGAVGVRVRPLCWARNDGRLYSLGGGNNGS